MIFSIESPGRGFKTALIGPGQERWTYSELAEQVQSRCRALAGNAKRLVFLFCQNTPSTVAWYLAAIEAGHVVALLAANLDEELRAKLIAAFSPDYVVLAECPGPEFTQHPDEPHLWSAPNRNSEIHPDLTLLLSTSGSTGSAKFVRLSLENITANAESITRDLKITEQDRPIAHLPLNYSYGLSVINSHLQAGASIVLSTASIIAPAFWKSVAEERVTSFSGVPYTYQMLRRLDLANLPAQSIQCMTQAGGKLDDRTILHFHGLMAARNGAFWVMYGQTEAVARIAILPSSDLPAKIGSAGRAVSGGSLRIATSDGLTAATGVEGELVYHGPNVMMGYAINRDDLAKGDELGGVLRTGDQARLDADRCVYILGRAARDVKIFGMRVNLDEIEALVKMHGPAAAVSGPENRVLVYCEFGDEAELQQLRGELSLKLKLHSSALQFRRIEKLPTHPSGKLDYTRLSVQA